MIEVLARAAAGCKTGCSTSATDDLETLAGWRQVLCGRIPTLVRN